MTNLRQYTKKNLGKTRFLEFFNNLGVTTWLIIINVIIFVFLWALVLFKITTIESILNYIALKPSDFMQGKHLWTIFTSMFAHIEIWHLFFNMFSLFFIGSFVEKIIGKKRYIGLYLISGIVGSLFFALLSGYFGDAGGLITKIFGDPTISGVGASGAIFGLLGVLAFVTPKARVYLIVGPLIAIIVEAVANNAISDLTLSTAISFIVQIYFIVSLLAIISFNPRWLKIAVPLNIPFWIMPLVVILPLIIISIFVSLPIGNMAHLGGFMAGAVYGFYLRKKYPNKIKMLNKMMGEK